MESRSLGGVVESARARCVIEQAPWRPLTCGCGRLRCHSALERVCDVDTKSGLLRHSPLSAPVIIIPPRDAMGSAKEERPDRALSQR